jgi:Uma2 family endonuclease
LQAGVPLVWIINPHHRTVAIYRPNQAPVLVNVTQELTGEPELPGFRVRVADLFA